MGPPATSPGKRKGFGVERRQPVMEGVSPPAGDAGQAAHVGNLLVVPAQRMVHVGQHLLAVGGRPDRILQASLGIETGPREADRDGSPEGTTRPLEGVALAIQAHLLGATAELAMRRTPHRVVRVPPATVYGRRAWNRMNGMIIESRSQRTRA
jgi:hypothetical protein